MHTNAGPSQIAMQIMWNRLIAVVDHAVQLLTEKPIDEVVEALEALAGTRFDPSVVEAFNVMNAKRPELATA